MATLYSEIYAAFLARIEEDDWLREEDLEVVQADMLEILKMAMFDFRFPRVSLELDGTNAAFVSTLGNSEIQVLATVMKVQWLRRQVNTWRIVKQQYSTKDFEFSSQANHLDKLLKSLDSAEKELRRTFDTYDRSRGGSVYPYHELAGGVPE
jgi:hypothetical protein